MTEILMNSLTLTMLLLGLAALIRYARHDRFAGPGTAHRASDELGRFTLRRRPS